jgi:N-methylhydantoinase B
MVKKTEELAYNPKGAGAPEKNKQVPMVTILKLANQGLSDGEVAIHDDRWLTYPWGVLGGQVGMRSTKRIVRTDGTEEWLPSKCEGIKVKVGDLLYFNTWGGGGWGDPLERDPTLVLADVNRNLASAEGARDYGVVITGGAVDEAATTAQREQMRSGRDEITTFNFGPPIEEIRANCKAETGLDAPEQPVFR